MPDHGEDLVDHLVRVPDMQEVELDLGEHLGADEQGAKEQHDPVLVVGAVVGLQVHVRK